MQRTRVSFLISNSSVEPFIDRTRRWAAAVVPICLIEAKGGIDSQTGSGKLNFKIMKHQNQRTDLDFHDHDRVTKSTRNQGNVNGVLGNTMCSMKYFNIMSFWTLVNHWNAGIWNAFPFINQQNLVLHVCAVPAISRNQSGESNSSGWIQFLWPSE